QDGFVNNPYFEEELDTIRLSAQGDVEFSIVTGVEFGINYSDRTKSKVNYGAFLVAPGYDAATASGDIAVPSEYIVGTTDLCILVLDSMFAYDGIRLFNDGVYTEIDATQYETPRLGDTYVVNGEVTTAYGMAKFEARILTGNIGRQVVSSDQQATGFDTQSRSAGTRDSAPDS